MPPLAFAKRTTQARIGSSSDQLLEAGIDWAGRTWALGLTLAWRHFGMFDLHTSGGVDAPAVAAGAVTLDQFVVACRKDF